MSYMFALSICLYVLAAAYWALDVSILRQEFLVMLPNLLSQTPDVKTSGDIAQSIAFKWYIQAILQAVIVRASAVVARDTHSRSR